MKCELSETGGCYWLQLEAETVKEAAQLVRLKLNTLSAPAQVMTDAYKDGGVFSQVILRKAAPARLRSRVR